MSIGVGVGIPVKRPAERRPGPPSDAILLEDGGYMLLEDSSYLLKE